MSYCWVRSLLGRAAFVIGDPLAAPAAMPALLQQFHTTVPGMKLYVAHHATQDQLTKHPLPGSSSHWTGQQHTPTTKIGMWRCRRRWPRPSGRWGGARLCSGTTTTVGVDGRTDGPTDAFGFGLSVATAHVHMYAQPMRQARERCTTRPQPSHQTGDIAEWKAPKSRRRYLNEGTNAGLVVEEQTNAELTPAERERVAEISRRWLEGKKGFGGELQMMTHPFRVEDEVGHAGFWFVGRVCLTWCCGRV